MCLNLHFEVKNKGKSEMRDYLNILSAIQYIRNFNNF